MASRKHNVIMGVMAKAFEKADPQVAADIIALARTSEDLNRRMEAARAVGFECEYYCGNQFRVHMPALPERSVKCEAREVKTLTPDQARAVLKFAKAEGRYWKTYLQNAWISGRDERMQDGGYLRQVRNDFGPSWLKRVKLEEIEALI